MTHIGPGRTIISVVCSRPPTHDKPRLIDRFIYLPEDGVVVRYSATGTQTFRRKWPLRCRSCGLDTAPRSETFTPVAKAIHESGQTTVELATIVAMLSHN